MNKAFRGVLIALAASCQGAPAVVPGQPDANEDPAARPPTIAAHTAGMDALPGFLPAWHDARAAKLYFEAPADGEELLYYVSLPAGLGSNRVGLDRGQLGPRRLVTFRRAGPRVHLVAPNLAWRSSSASETERRAVEDSFAASVLWGFDVVAETDGRALVDGTAFFLRDAHGVARSLRNAGQGSFSLDESRSALWMETTRGFPDNTEIEALLTFTGDDPGGEVRRTAADPRAVSVRVRHSFVRLPELGSGYEPRDQDPRGGFYSTSWKDMAAAVDAPLQRNVINRHRLERGGEPITYYVDRAAPEPVRTALVEGARYWAPVFEQAGFPGGFQVELLPEDADPQDVRYNVIQWVHRSTRGWSYGMSVTDPRTGEILKGHVSLGALRVRQDVLLAEGLLSPYAAGDGESDERVLDMALARIRQLSAHEVGHTLGLVHNFAASISDRASVMDYPAPRVHLSDDGVLDLSDAYAPGCGKWDELAIRYGYGDDPEGVLREMEASGIAFLTDADARGTDRAHPLANLWDDGADPVAGLEHEIRVRRIALDNFSEAAVQAGERLSVLEDALVPLYFRHRYQLEACVRQLGGVNYAHTVRGGEPAEVRPVDAEVQRRALEATLVTLQPDFLALPEALLALIPPPAPGSDPAAERFDDGDLLVDPVGIRASAIRLTLDLLLHPTRAARMVDQKVADPDQPGFDTVCEQLMARGWAPPAGEDGGELRTQLLDRFMEMASADDVPQRVRRIAHKSITEVQRLLEEGTVRRDTIEAQRQALWEENRIRHFFADPLAARPTPVRHPIPPGSPIGCGYDGGGY